MKRIFFLLLSIGSLPLAAQKFSGFNLYFETGKGEISPSEKHRLDSLLKPFEKDAVFDIKVTGYTDQQGSDHLNQSLSEKRAHTVANLLKTHFPHSHISSEGKSFTDLVYTGADTGKFALNRRVSVDFFRYLPHITSIGSEKQSPEIFRIAPNDSTRVTAKSGTRIFFPPQAFAFPDEKPVDDTITVEYIEYRDPIDFILGGIPMTHTEKNREYIFNSSGMFKISGKVNDNEVVVNEGKKIQFDFNLTQDIPGTNFYNYDTSAGSWSQIGTLQGTNDSLTDDEHLKSIKASCLLDNCQAMTFLGNAAMTYMDSGTGVYEKLLKKIHYRDKDVVRLNHRYEKQLQNQGHKGFEVAMLQKDLRALHSSYHLEKLKMEKGVLEFKIHCDSCASDQFAGFKDVTWQYHYKDKKKLEPFLNESLAHCYLSKPDKKDRTNVELILEGNAEIVLKKVREKKNGAGHNLAAAFRQYQKIDRTKRNDFKKTNQLLTTAESDLVKISNSIDSIKNYFDAGMEPARIDSLSCFYEKSTDYMPGYEKEMFGLVWFRYFDLNREKMRERYLSMNDPQVQADTCAAVEQREMARQEVLRKQALYRKVMDDKFSNIKSSLSISSFGTYNCDRLVMYTNRVNILANYVDENNDSLEIANVFMIDHSINTVMAFNGAYGMWPHKFAYGKTSTYTLIAFDKECRPYICKPEAFQEAVKAYQKVKTFHLKRIDQLATRKDMLALSE